MKDSLITGAKVIVCVGSGGVGKTTLSAALGVLAARMGKKVLVLTIDPAKRLAQTLGIEGQSDITRVPNQNFSGELYASVIDHKKTFDDFVRKAAGTEERVQRIYNNALYRQLSTGLSGSQEFTALEKLYASYESQEFDLIILDTPPTKHAIDFLNAPQKLTALFNDKVTRWFKTDDEKAGFLTGILQSGTKKVFKVLEFLTGGTFVQELSDFFKGIESWQGRLLSRVNAVQEMLSSEETKFVLITSFDEAKLKEAEFFAKEIKKGGHNLNAVVINRTFPFWLDIGSANEHSGAPDMKRQYFEEMREYYRLRSEQYLQFEKKMEQSSQVFKVPDLVIDVSDLESLAKVADLL